MIQDQVIKLQSIDTSNPKTRILVDLYNCEIRLLTGWKEEIQSKINHLHTKVILTEERFNGEKYQIEIELQRVKNLIKSLQGK